MAVVAADLAEVRVRISNGGNFDWINPPNPPDPPGVTLIPPTVLLP